MNNLYFCLILLFIISCSNSEQTKARKNSTGYLESDLAFIEKADNICRTIDIENTFEQIKNEVITDLDGKKYNMNYKGYSKNSSDSIVKVIITLLLGGKNSAISTIYYNNGAILKGTAEIFADDTVRTAFYYEPDKMIYPQEEGMDKAAQKLLDKSIGLRNIFSSK
jgi:hypothetical protein